MTLQELSEEYSAGAEMIRARIRELTAQEDAAEEEQERLLLHSRIRLLSSMWRDMREVAALTGHYYERGYCRNEKYIL